MRLASVYTLCPFFAAARLFADNAYLNGDVDSPATGEPSPALIARLEDPLETSRASLPVLELRQDAALPAPGLAFPAAYDTSLVPSTSCTSRSAKPAASPTVAAAAAAVAPVALVKQAATVPETTTPLQPVLNVTGDDYVSVQWVETWMNSTSRTWVPQTFTVHFPSRTPGPSPGRGQIGMGTLTGEAGHTKTLLVGAAPTQAAGLAKGIAAAVGAGLFGLLA